MKCLAAFLLLLPLQGGADDTAEGLRLGSRAETYDPLANQAGSFQVLRREATDGGLDRWTVLANRAPLQKLLVTIGHKSGDTIEGLQRLDRIRLITVDLRERPLDQILKYVLGSVGLDFDSRANTISLRFPEDEHSTAETIQLAAAAWVNATKRFPDHPDAPLAFLSQGELLELQNYFGPALDKYETLIESYPKSMYVDDAYMRSGRILQRMGEWGEASKQFRRLTELGNDPAYQPAARLEVARCDVELGSPQSAIYILERLDSEYPTINALETAGRLLVHASALNALGRHDEALKKLTAASPNLDPLANREAMKVRANCFEGLGRYSDASHAWLVYGRSTSPREKEAALRQAARLALLAPGEEAAVFFICKEAESIPPQESFEEFRLEAERRLTVGSVDEPMTTGTADRIALAEGWLDAGDVARAAKELEVLFLTRGTLADEAVAARVCVGWARCVEQQRDLNAAILILAEARTGFASLTARSLLDLGAAALLEKHQLYDRAVDAYEGRY